MLTLYTDESTREFVGQPIVKEEIQEMTSYYKQTLQQSVFPDDSTSAWISINELMDLINANPGANGLRIYFGRHKKQTFINGLDYTNFHNVILVTTSDTVNPDDPSVDTSLDLLKAGANYLLYTNNGGDNIPTKPPTKPPTTF